MKVITNIARVATIGVVVLVIGGCDTVSRDQYLNTAYGPGKAPETYRVGGPRVETASGSRVTLIRRAEVDSGWNGPATQPAATQPGN